MENMPTTGVRRYTDQERAEAIALAVEVGPSEAGRRLEVPKGTIARWASAAGVATGSGKERTAKATQAARQWSERRQALRDRTGKAAEEALARLRETIRSGKAIDARHLAIAYGVLVDKANGLHDITVPAELNSTTKEEFDQEVAELVEQINSAAYQRGLAEGRTQAQKDDFDREVAEVLSATDVDGVRPQPPALPPVRAADDDVAVPYEGSVFGTS